MEDARDVLARVEAEQQPAPFTFTGDFTYRNAWTPPREGDAIEANAADFVEAMDAAMPLRAAWLPRLRGMRKQRKQEANTDG